MKVDIGNDWEPPVVWVTPTTGGSVIPNVRKRPEADCPTCGKRFSKTHPKQRFCSRPCIRSKGRAHNVCPCGVNTGSYQKKYCSPEHRALYGKKKAPTRMVTKVCQECGEEFERPHHYPGKMMFCSIGCSNRQNSRYRQQHFKFGNVHLASGFELRFLACLLRHDVDWSPWPDDDPFLYEGHEYRPDFRVGHLAIEVKGYEDEDHPQRRARELWDRDEILFVVDKGKLSELERCSSRSEFLGCLPILSTN